eukprot:365660-Chlamydomonas_euryale.AAC.10
MEVKIVPARASRCHRSEQRPQPLDHSIMSYGSGQPGRGAAEPLVSGWDTAARARTQGRTRIRLRSQGCQQADA